MTEFLKANLPNIIAIAVTVIVLVALYCAGYKKKIHQILFFLVVKAEAEFGSGTGLLKYHAVVAWLYERIPAVVRFFLTEKELDRLIESAVSRMKEYLLNNAQAKAHVFQSKTKKE